MAVKSAVRPGGTREVFRAALRFFWTYPSSIVPLVFAWCVFAAVILYMQFFFDWAGVTVPAGLGLALGCFVLFSLVYGIACLIVLELAQQAKATGKPQFWKAVGDALVRDLWRAFPILLVWGLIWFVLLLLQVILTPKREKREKEDFSPRAAVGTLLGEGNKFSLFSIPALLRALGKGVRMLAFLIFPAIAWEELSPGAAFRKGFRVLSVAKAQFMKAYVSTGLFAAVIMIPAALVYKISDMLSLSLPDGVWYAVLVYMALATSLAFLVEQLYTAQIYLWYMDYEARHPGLNTMQPLESVPKPAFFDLK